MEKIQQGFLWDGDSLEWRIHVVKWDIACSCKNRGWFGYLQPYIGQQCLTREMVGLEVCDREQSLLEGSHKDQI